MTTIEAGQWTSWPLKRNLLIYRCFHGTLIPGTGADVEAGEHLSIEAVVAAIEAKPSCAMIVII